MTPEEIWRRKSDEELVAASTHLGEYTDAGQRIILAELQRRRESGFQREMPNQAEASDANPWNGAPDEGLDARRGYLVRLWKGAVSLPVAYWVWGMVGNAAWNILIGLASQTDRSALVLSVAALSILYYVFVFVAVWRSAGRYRGNRIWADLARVSLALGLIGTVAGLFVHE